MYTGLVAETAAPVAVAQFVTTLARSVSDAAGTTAWAARIIPITDPRVAGLVPNAGVGR